MRVIQYLRPYVGKLFLLGSGIVLGVNNYDLISKSKDYFFPVPKEESSMSQISYLEQLVELKDE